MDFDFLRLRPSEKVEPDEEFPVTFDVVLYNASPYDLLPSPSLHLQFFIQSEDASSKIEVKPSADLEDVEYRLYQGIAQGEELRLNDVEAEFTVSAQTCNDDEQMLCVIISSKERSSIVLRNGDTSKRCVPFHFECVNGMYRIVLKLTLVYATIKSDQLQQIGFD